MAYPFLHPSMLQAGQALPPIRFEAAVTGRAIDNALLSGRRAVLMVHGARNTEVPKSVARVVRERWPGADEVLLATIVDLRSFAGVWRRVAEAQVRATHGKLSAKVVEMGLDPAEHVLIVADWEGQAAKALGVDEPDKAAAAIVVGRDGKVAGVATGDGVADQVLGLLDQ